VYEVDPLVCPRCSAPMRILAVITEPEEVRKILLHLVKIGRSPPGFAELAIRPPAVSREHSAHDNRRTTARSPFSDFTWSDRQS
jgi:hypothetical protein